MAARRAVSVGVVMVVCMLAISDNKCLAATVSVGQGSGRSGATGTAVSISLSSGAGEQVAAAQFDVVFDSAVLDLTDVTVGPAAADAEKDVSFSTWEPGVVRVVILGLNDNVITDGVIAEALFDIASDVSSEEETISLDNVLLSDPSAGEVTAVVSSGSISITVPEGVPVVGMTGLALVANIVALTGALSIRRKVTYSGGMCVQARRDNLLR